MYDVRLLIDDPNDIVDAAHTSAPGFINRYTDRILTVTSFQGRIEVARIEPHDTDQLPSRLDQLKNVPTKLIQRNLGDLQAILAWFDRVTYAVLCLVLYHPERKLAEAVAWTSPLGVLPEDVLLHLTGQPPRGSAFSLPMTWAASLITDKKPAVKIEFVDQYQPDTELAEVYVSPAGCYVDGFYVGW